MYLDGRRCISPSKLTNADIQGDLELIKFMELGLALTLSSEGLDSAELEDIRIAHQTSLGLPVFLPKENGVKEIAALISQFLM